ncbi:MAG: hypothetical protein LBM95_06245 [Lactobacillales bacterium]|jgi:hypothetical protein|nr:hypothetical protein [Lactobacillales bacterium]
MNIFILNFCKFNKKTKLNLKLFFVGLFLVIGIQFIPTTIVRADVIVQGTMLTDKEYYELVDMVPEGYAIVSNERYESLIRQRATTGLFHQAHVQNYGWLPTYNISKNFVGTVGKGLRLEALKLIFQNMSTNISYRAHVQSIGWQSWVSNGGIAGTTGRNLRIEALQITTSGKFGVFYSGHVESIGWGKWVSSGATTIGSGQFIGTTGQSKRLEAVDFILYEQQF